MFKHSKAAALIATALAVLAGAVAGCGSSGDSATTSASAPPVTQPGGSAAFVSDVEAICVEVNRRLGRLGEADDDRELASMTGRAAVIIGEATRQMRAVEAPEDVAPDYERFVVLLDQQADGLADTSRWTRAGDLPKVRAAQARIEEANREQDLIAAGIGLEACAASAEEEEPAPGGGAPFGGGGGGGGGGMPFGGGAAGAAPGSAG